MERLKRLLDYLEEHINPDHCCQVQDRYRRALSFETICRPPLVISCDESPLGLRPFGYAEAFDNPAKMMFNQLLSQVALGVKLRDDSPLAIRNDHGIIQVGAYLGGQWQITEDNHPWMGHIENRQQLEQVVFNPLRLDLEKGGIIRRSLETLRFYRQTLSEYPICRKSIQISMPDLQGPFDNAHLLWGNEVFNAFYTEPGFLSALMDRMVEAMLVLEKIYRPLTKDHLQPFGTTQHTYVIPGRLLIRDDTSIMVSPDMYREFIGSHHARLLKEVGRGSIHSCGNAQHLVDGMLEIPNMVGLDLSQPELMDIEKVYKKCASRQVSITDLHRSAEDLISGRAWKMFPTGVVFVYRAKTLQEAKGIAKAYFQN
ncbi:MAG: hypothetical protein QGG67_20535 [Gammaproteobacteria bacterium]|jgi:hypothetical protein|nr:hypothetical protein [Gammaproteobacteria bacterium]